jgi:general secretion pathway protein C
VIKHQLNELRYARLDEYDCKFVPSANAGGPCFATLAAAVRGASANEPELPLFFRKAVLARVWLWLFSMASQAVLKGCFRGVVLALLGGAAYFQASAVTRLLACALASPPFAAGAAVKAPSPPQPPPTATSLLERNAFDSLTGPIAATTAPRQPDYLDDPLSAPLCDSTLLYIVSESADQRSSLATLRGTGEARPRLRRVGDQVENSRVEYIGFNPRQATPAVWLSSGRALCQAVLFAAKSSEPVARTGRAPRSLVPGTGQTPRTLAAEPPERLRIVPELKGGKLLGVRLFGIQPNGAFAAIGLKNGDRLEAINGQAMNSPERALSLYVTLRTTSDFDLRIMRQGLPLSIKLHLK